jgi:hypothetical protein
MRSEAERQAAWEKYKAAMKRDGHGGIARSIAWAAFTTGWEQAEASLQADNARLRAALKPVDADAAERVSFWEDDWNPEYHVNITLTVAECRAIRNALTEPTP